MRDKNFFEPYIDNKDNKIGRQKVIAILSGGLSAVLIVYIVFNMTRIQIFKKDITRISNELTQEKILDKKERIDSEKVILSELKQIETKIDYVSLELNKKNKLGSDLLESIINSMPNNIFLKSIDLNEDVITLVGISRNKQDIAQLESNLRQVIYFEDIFIPTITSEEEFFSFTTTISFIEENLIE